MTTPAPYPSSGPPLPLSAPNGGTGATTLATHGVLVGQGTSAVHVASPGTAGQVLTSNGASADPTMQDATGGSNQPTLIPIALTYLDFQAAAMTVTVNFGSVRPTPSTLYLIEINISGVTSGDPSLTHVQVQWGYVGGLDAILAGNTNLLPFGGVGMQPVGGGTAGTPDLSGKQLCLTLVGDGDLSNLTGGVFTGGILAWE